MWHVGAGLSLALSHSFERSVSGARPTVLDLLQTLRTLLTAGCECSDSDGDDGGSNGGCEGALLLQTVVPGANAAPCEAGDLALLDCLEDLCVLSVE